MLIDGGVELEESVSGNGIVSLDFCVCVCVSVCLYVSVCVAVSDRDRVPVSMFEQEYGSVAVYFFVCV